MLEPTPVLKTEQYDYLQFKSVLISHYLFVKRVNFIGQF